jgi:hypothetical protein
MSTHNTIHSATRHHNVANAPRGFAHHQAYLSNQGRVDPLAQMRKKKLRKR